MRFIIEGLGDFFEPLECELTEMEGIEPFKILQVIGEKNRRIAIVDPCLVRPEYVLDVTKTDLKSLSNEKHRQTSTERLNLYCMVKVGKGPMSSLVNLQSPIILNPLTGKGKVLRNMEYPKYEKLFQGEINE